MTVGSNTWAPFSLSTKSIQGFCWPRVIIGDTYSGCCAVVWNPRPHGWEGNFLTTHTIFRSVLHSFFTLLWIKINYYFFPSPLSLLLLLSFFKTKQNLSPFSNFEQWDYVFFHFLLAMFYLFSFIQLQQTMASFTACQHVYLHSHSTLLVLAFFFCDCCLWYLY